MIFDVLYIILAILGLGLLVFIHELGHYFMAKKEGMKIEVFSIGFGKALYSWKRGQVKWQIGILPFGGYVKIAGMEKKKEGPELSDIKDGFFGKTPWQRIKVAFAGPLVNLIFAFCAFTLLWISGGRDQAFQFFSKKIGAIYTDSSLYTKGIRAGDEILKYNERPYKDFKDLIFASVSKKNELSISGNQIDYYHQLKSKPFSLTLKTYPLEIEKEKNFSTIGIENPANLLIYDQKATIASGNPSVQASGIQDQDRLLWADGELIFSLPQLLQSINEPTCFLTIKRAGQIVQDKFYKVKIEDLKMTYFDENEVNDWKYEARLSGKLNELFFLNYFFNKKGIVENRLSLLDEKLAEKVYRSNFGALQKGDQILAVDGVRVASSYDILKALQKRKVLMIVQRGFNPTGINSQNCDHYFDKVFLETDILKMVQSIGLKTPISSAGELHLLKPIEPMTLAALMQASSHKELFNQELLEKEKTILKNRDAKEREAALSLLKKQTKELRLGMGLVDVKVNYNPTPGALFASSFKEMQRTITALFTGQIHPKWMAGPVGIVQMMHRSWSVSFWEALYWLGFISLNLGLINLVPLPVLDGGHILFSIVESITGKPLKAKTMERLIIPFVVMLILFFVYMTYNDLLRLIKGFF